MSQHENISKAFINFGERQGSFLLSALKGQGIRTESFQGRSGVVLPPPRKVRHGKWISGGTEPEDRCYLFLKMSDRFLLDRNSCESVKITVDYFDLGDGCFTLIYDGTDSAQTRTEIVDLFNTHTWKSHTFDIQNPNFSGRCGGYDFKVGTFSKFMGASPDAVCIGKITVEKRGTCCPIRILPAISCNPGNIFFNGDSISMTVNMINRTPAAYSLTAEYSAVDSHTCRTVWDFRDSVRIGGKEKLQKTVRPEISRYGTYVFQVKLWDEGKRIWCEKKTRMSKVNSSMEVPANRTLGFSDHFAQGGKGDPEIPLMLMRKGGFGINRDEILWADYEKEPDHFVFPSFELDYLKKAQKYGIEPCYTLGKNNAAIGVEHCPARTAFEQEHWKRYVHHVAAELKGKIKLYSIYNEANLALKKTENVHWYVEDLKIAYEEIKSVDPDAIVLGFTAANMPYYWLEEAFRQGALRYCDVVDIHPYCWDTPPEEFNFVERVKRVYQLIQKYGGKQPVWNTEFGYPIMPKGCGIRNEILQGEYLMHTYLYCRANHILDKFYIYQFADSNSRNRANAESSFGVLFGVRPEIRETPYAAKSSFLMLANMNRLISDAECMGEFFCHDRMTLIRFRKPDGRQIFAYWAFWNTTENMLTLDLGTNEVISYDPYGNAEKQNSGNGVFEFPVTYTTRFIEGDFKVFKDLSDYPA